MLGYPQVRQRSGQSPGMDLEVAVELSGISEQLCALGKLLDDSELFPKTLIYGLGGETGQYPGLY